MNASKPAHVVAVVGGACAGSTTAQILADKGCVVVVFDQNPRPYGKIEDGLPRWHAKQRHMEYEKINERLDRPGIHFVPKTRLGADIDFKALANEWGWSALVLANGAWKDREISSAPGASDVVDRGLIYQNPFVYWFNHQPEASYDGPSYEVQDGAVVVGGGLASIDVIKIIQLELYGRALRARGIEADMYEMEEKGIPKYCKEHGIDDPTTLGVEGGLLCYRRRAKDMPLANLPDDPTEKQKAKIAQVRQKILNKCLDKFLFKFQPQVLAKEFLLDDDGSIKGLRLIRTQVEGRRASEVAGSEFEVSTRQVISSIGSIPEPIEGIVMSGAYYKFKDWDTGEYAEIPGVYGAGNVVTGQGNIKASVDHGRQVGEHLIEVYLGVADDDGERDLQPAMDAGSARGATMAEAVARDLAERQPLPAETVDAILERVGARQREVGFDGDYRGWIAANTPPDMP